MREINYGDVFKIKTKAGKGYFQYVKDIHESKCQLIRKLPGVYSIGKNPDIEALVEKKEDFFVFFKLRDALKKRRVKLMGNFSISEDVIIPRYYRYQHIIGGKFISWHIINIETQEIRPVIFLSNKEKTLSPGNLWDYQVLANKISEGWLPEYWK